MARLSHTEYLRHLQADSARLREALAGCAPTAQVPACPDWTAADLLAHHAHVLDFWATIVERRPITPDELEEPEMPSAYDELFAFHDAQATRLASALSDADPADAAWTWSAEQTVGFTFRRQAHEALIHRLDAEQTAGATTPLDPALAADGVQEALDVMLGGQPAWGTFTPAAPDESLVRVECADTGDRIWVELGRFTGTSPEGKDYDLDDLRVVSEPEDRRPAAVVSGPAAALDAWLWRRADVSEVETSGDGEVVERFRRCVDQPIT